MPRPRPPGKPAPKTRSRAGCAKCKERKVKCDEQKPICLNCRRLGDRVCDYSLRLKWDGSRQQDIFSGTQKVDFSVSETSIAGGGSTPTSSGRENSNASTPATPNFTPLNFAEDLPPSLPPSLPLSLHRPTSQPQSPHAPQVSPSQFRQSEMSFIDPNLMESPTPMFSHPNSPFSMDPPLDHRLRKRARREYGQDSNQSHLSSAQAFIPTSSSSPEMNNYTENGSIQEIASMPTSFPSSNQSQSNRLRESLLKMSPHMSNDTPDLRRLSVNSLLSGPAGPSEISRNYHSKSKSGLQDFSVPYQDILNTTTYGIDRGIKDLDIGKNDDMNAITGVSPVLVRDHLELVLDDEGDLDSGFGGETSHTAFESGGYYNKPVAISIPTALHPLPYKLHENPMNLLVSSIPISVVQLLTIQ